MSSEYVCPHCVKNHVLFNKTSIEKDVMMTIEKPFTSKLKQLWFESDTIKSQLVQDYMTLKRLIKITTN